MSKLARWKWIGKLVQWLVGLPGMWDDMATWKRTGLKLLAGSPVLTVTKIRLWFVVSGTPWDQVILMLGILALPVTGYVVIISGLVTYTRKRKQIAGRGFASRRTPAVPKSEPEPTANADIKWTPGEPCYQVIRKSPLVDKDLTSAEQSVVANSLLRRFGRDHPEAYRKRRGDPEVVLAVFHQWLDGLVIRKVDLQAILDEDDDQ